MIIKSLIRWIPSHAHRCSRGIGAGLPYTFRFGAVTSRQDIRGLFERNGGSYINLIAL